MHLATLSLGANIGEPALQMAEAIASLRAQPELTVIAVSAMIFTKPWGNVEQNDFLNCAILIETDLTPEALLDVCQAIENELGRVRAEKWGPRVIDIDIITYDREEIDTERLKVPHIFAHEREFVLEPLREIAPDAAKWIVERKN